MTGTAEAAEAPELEYRKRALLYGVFIVSGACGLIYATKHPNCWSQGEVTHTEAGERPLAFNSGAENQQPAVRGLGNAPWRARLAG